MASMDFELFKQEFDPDGELTFDVAEVITQDMQDEWQDLAAKVDSLWECDTEKQLLQRIREIKEQVAQWPG